MTIIIITKRFRARSFENNTVGFLGYLENRI